MHSYANFMDSRKMRNKRILSMGEYTTKVDGVRK